MNVLILGSYGIQGRAAVYDLARDPDVTQVVCANFDTDFLGAVKPFAPFEKVRPVTVETSRKEHLSRLYDGANIVIDFLPKGEKDAVYEAAVESRTPVVSTGSARDCGRLDERAKAAGIAIMPECGLSPGLDQVVCGHAGQRFDTLTLVNSYCGAFPEKSACTNPLNYKISWNLQEVLRALNRGARVIRRGKAVDISNLDRYDPSNIRVVDVPGLGDLEAFPGKDAVVFTGCLGEDAAIREAGCYTLRWPGWCDFWRPLMALGLTVEQPVGSLGCSPLDMLEKSLVPQLQYDPDEKDLVVMINIFQGEMAGKKARMTSTMVIKRDLDTGIMGMDKAAGYTASTVAKMITKGTITPKGVLSAAAHIPAQPFIESLDQKGIQIKEELVVLE